MHGRRFLPDVAAIGRNDKRKLTKQLRQHDWLNRHAKKRAPPRRTRAGKLRVAQNPVVHMYPNAQHAYNIGFVSFVHQMMSVLFLTEGL